MDIQDGVGECCAEGGTEPAHEPREADDADAAGAELVDERAVEVVTRGERFVIDDDGVDARQSRALESLRAGPIGDDDPHARIEASVADSVDERLKIAPPPRDQYADHPIGVRPHSSDRARRELIGV